MDILEQVRIVGTNHISAESLEHIKKEFLDFEPQILAVELDRQRLVSLEQGDQKISFKAIKILGIRGFLFVLISRYVQQRLGRMTGIKPGSEMMYTVSLAKGNNLPLALVDQPIHTTIRRLMRKITFIEIIRFISDIFVSILPFGKKKQVKINLGKVPSEKIIDMLIGELEKRYPSIYSVLIYERNQYMSKRLVILAKRNPEKKILCVVGAGHKKGMKTLLTLYDSSLEIVEKS